MKSSRPGRSTSRVEVEVQGVSAHGLWLLVRGVELMVPFSDYPALKDATIAQLYAVELLHGVHLRWQDLDVDIEVEALVSPEQFPLEYRP